MSDSQVPMLIKRKEGTDDVPMPKYMTAHAAGMDLCAAVDETVTLAPGDIAVIPTGFYMALPPGYEAQVRPRSGLSLKHGISVANAPGTIDADYRGEVGVILVNLGKASFDVTRGMRVAQMVVAPVTTVSVSLVDELPSSERGAGGFGSTGHAST